MPLPTNGNRATACQSVQAPSLRQRTLFTKSHHPDFEVCLPEGETLPASRPYGIAHTPSGEYCVRDAGFILIAD